MTDYAGVPVPAFGDSPEELAAWYGPFGWAEHYRKVVLASCAESLRAQASLTGAKISEARLDHLARLHGAYLQFLAGHLQGRVKWEREVLKRGFGS